MRNKLGMLCIITSSSSVAASLLLGAPAGISLVLLSSALFYLCLKRLGRRSGAIDNDSMQFVGNFIENYTDSISTTKLVDLSLSQGFWFCNDMKDAMAMYKMCGDAEYSFSKLLCCDSAAMRETASIISQRLDNGIECLALMKEIKKRTAMENRHSMRALAGSISSNSVIRLGSMLFFPVFAGISMQIADFTEASQGVAALNAGALLLIFPFFIIIMNLTNFRYS